MIEINLVPKHLRKSQGAGLAIGVKIPLEVLIGIGGGLIFLLVVAHAIFFFLNIKILAQHKEAKNQWEEILPFKKNVDVVMSEVRDLKGRVYAIENILGNGEIVWAQKLNLLSDNLPRGVWLTQIRLKEKILKIDGRAISRKNMEMINVHSVIANLKKEKKFLEQLQDLELTSIARSKIKKIEIADFSITTKLESYEPPTP